MEIRKGLRPQLGVEPERGWRTSAVGKAFRTPIGADDGNLYNGAGDPILQRQFSGWQRAWKRRDSLWQALWSVSGDATFSGFAESGEFPLHRAPGGRAVRFDNGLQIFKSVAGTASRRILICRPRNKC